MGCAHLNAARTYWKDLGTRQKRFRRFLSTDEASICRSSHGVWMRTGFIFLCVAKMIFQRNFQKALTLPRLFLCVETRLLFIDDPSRLLEHVLRLPMDFLLRRTLGRRLRVNDSLSFPVLHLASMQPRMLRRLMQTGHVLRYWGAESTS